MNHCLLFRCESCDGFLWFGLVFGFDFLCVRVCLFVCLLAFCFSLPPFLYWQEKLGTSKKGSVVLALGRRCIQLPHVLLPEEAIDLKGRRLSFPARLIQQKSLPLISGGAVTQKYKSMKACFLFHGAGVALWIPSAEFQDWRKCAGMVECSLMAYRRGKNCVQYVYTSLTFPSPFSHQEWSTEWYFCFIGYKQADELICPEMRGPPLVWDSLYV